MERSHRVAQGAEPHYASSNRLLGAPGERGSESKVSFEVTAHRKGDQLEAAS
jgi:hypothetical protein